MKLSWVVNTFSGHNRVQFRAAKKGHRVHGLLLAPFVVSCAGMLIFAPAAIADSWVQLLPLPETRGLRCLTYANGTYYAGGLGGALLSSQDGFTWIDQSTGYTNAILAATAGNGLVLFGGYDHILISSNGLSWQQVTNPASDYPGALGFGNGRYVYLGVAGSIASSTNAVDWTLHHPTDGQQQFEAFCYGNGMFVGLGQRGIYSSPDGIVWSQVFTPLGNGPDAGVYAGGQFLAGDIDGHLYQSADGQSWSQISITLPGGITSLLFDGNQYVAVLNNGTSFGLSPNGTNWTYVLPSTSVIALTALYAGGRLILAGSSGGLISGPSLPELTVINPGLGADLVDVAAGPTNYVAVTSRFVLLSADGLTWRRLPGSPSRDMHFIRYSGARYFAGAEAGVFFSSSNGVDWTESSLPTTATLHSLASDGSLEVLVGSFGATLYSADGTTWQSGSGGWTGGDITYNDVTWANGTWVCVGNGRLITSTNGINWQIRPIDTSWYLNHVTFAENKFVAVGLNGIVLTSPDGATWTQQSAPTTQDLSAVTFFKENFVATIGPRVPGASSLPGVITSTNGINWATNSFLLPPFVGLNGITHDTQITLTVGSSGYIYRLGEMSQPILALQNIGGALEYTLSGQPSVNPALEQSDDMQHWTAPTFILNAAATVRFKQLPVPGAPKQFYRISVK